LLGRSAEFVVKLVQNNRTELKAVFSEALETLSADAWIEYLTATSSAVNFLDQRLFSQITDLLEAVCDERGSAEYAANHIIGISKRRKYVREYCKDLAA